MNFFFNHFRVWKGTTVCEFFFFSSDSSSRLTVTISTEEGQRLIILSIGWRRKGWVVIHFLYQRCNTVQGNLVSPSFPV